MKVCVLLELRDGGYYGDVAAVVTDARIARAWANSARGRYMLTYELDRVNNLPEAVKAALGEAGRES